MSQPLLDKASRGDIDSQINLAMKYEYGIGVKQDYGEAVRWYQLAAKQQNCLALHRLSKLAALGHVRDGKKVAIEARAKANARGKTLVDELVKEVELEKPQYLIPTPKLSGKKILVVDDDRATREMVKTVLEHYGYRVVIAVDGQDALDQVGEHVDISTILCDIQMPRVNGLQFIRFLRKMKMLEGIPVVMVTSQTDQKLVKLAMQLGVKSWLVKPFQREKLIKTVEALYV